MHYLRYAENDVMSKMMKSALVYLTSIYGFISNSKNSLTTKNGIIVHQHTNTMGSTLN